MKDFNPVHVGFTGTQEGMTDDQWGAIHDFVLDNPHFRFAHHGDCIGADEQFHQIVKPFGLWTVGHPPINPVKRAFCDFDAIEEPKEYLDRNKDIVDASQFMFVVPKGFKEELRSGTWSTARYARNKEVHGLIFWPDGTVSDLIEE